MLVGSERAFLIQGCEAGTRADGRGCLEWRPILINTSVVAAANGSARVRIGATDVIVGVKAEITTPAPERPDHGKLQLSVECSACAGPTLQGRAAEALSAGLTKLLERFYSDADAAHGLELSQLGIVAAKKCWVLYVDVLIIGVDGSLADATSLAIKTALADTEVPAVTVVQSEADGTDIEPELDVDEENSMTLDVSGMPVIVTVGQVGAACLTDLTAAEEACCSATLQAAVSSSGSLCGMTKQGHSVISPDLLLDMMKHAQTCGPLLSARLAEVLHGDGEAMQS